MTIESETANSYSVWHSCLPYLHEETTKETTPKHSSRFVTTTAWTKVYKFGGDGLQWAHVVALVTLILEVCQLTIGDVEWEKYKARIQIKSSELLFIKIDK